jgi:hypothetical protein
VGHALPARRPGARPRAPPRGRLHPQGDVHRLGRRPHRRHRRPQRHRVNLGHIHQYSDDGVNVINGTESVSAGGTLNLSVTWHENLTLSGCDTGTKVTNEPGGYTEGPIDVFFRRYQPTGTMTTTLDGVTYKQPVSYH